MGRLYIYSYKKERLYLCSDIRSRGAKKYSLSFLTKLWIQNWAPSIYKHSIDSFHNNSKKNAPKDNPKCVIYNNSPKS